MGRRAIGTGTENRVKVRDRVFRPKPEFGTESDRDGAYRQQTVSAEQDHFVRRAVLAGDENRKIDAGGGWLSVIGAGIPG